MTKALVTGCAGFIGSHLAERLVHEGHEVIGVDSFEDYYPRQVKERNIAGIRGHAAFELVEQSILDSIHGNAKRSLKELVGWADVVFHLAAQPGVRSSWGEKFRVYEENNVLATQALLEACKRLGVERFIYASSSSVYGDTKALPMRETDACAPYSPYGVTKLAAEHLTRLYARNFDLHTVSLRFFTVYGPRQRPDMAFQRFIQEALAGRPLQLYGDGSQTRDFTYVSDIVEGLLLAVNAPKGTVANLAGGSRVTMLEALRTLEDAIGTTVTIERADTQPGDVRDTWASIDVAGDVLGYRPQTRLADGLLAQVEWCRESLDEGLRDTGKAAG